VVSHRGCRCVGLSVWLGYVRVAEVGKGRSRVAFWCVGGVSFVVHM